MVGWVFYSIFYFRLSLALSFWRCENDIYQSNVEKDNEVGKVEDKMESHRKTEHSLLVISLELSHGTYYQSKARFVFCPFEFDRQ